MPNMAADTLPRIMKSMETHFYNHGKSLDAKSNESTERSKCHWCQIKDFPRHKSAPLTIINEVDKCELPKGFRFIQSMEYGKGVTQVEESFRTGCDCTNEKLCMDDGCECLSEMVGVDQPRAYAYHIRGEKKGLIRSDLLQTRLPLYECHDKCACTETCPNRVVERGRTLPLQIFRTDDGRGWGVRCAKSIKKGQFIDTYLGEIITSEEADRRRANAKSAQNKDIYLFALDKFSDPESPDPRLRGPPLEVDGEFISGPTRFINHSCDPNLRIFARVGCHTDKHLHELAFFALKDIETGTELTFDYVDGKEHDDMPTKGGTRCLCGSAKCRKWLW